MFKSIAFFVAIVLMTCVHSTYIHESVAKKQILEEFSSKPTKQLFKVWHFLFNKSYDYNSQEGIEKYKVFRTNWKAVQEHNSKDFSWKQGLNHLSDLTVDQIVAYYKIKELPAVQKSNIRALGAVSLDDYNDVDEESFKPDDDPMNVRQTPVDWTDKMQPIRDQGGCGSCWAYSAGAAIEGMYGVAGKPLTDWLSTQEWVDCDTTNSGCNGGWPTKAFSYVVTNGIALESSYPYMGYKGVCNRSNAARSNAKLSGYYYNTSGANTITYLAKGPLSSAMAIYNYSDPTYSFFAYAGGIYDSALCLTTGVNHGVNLVGYGVDASGKSYWKVRNSWGTYWGEEGYFRISNWANNFSCMITRYTMQPYVV